MILPRDYIMPIRIMISNTDNNNKFQLHNNNDNKRRDNSQHKITSLKQYQINVIVITSFTYIIMFLISKISPEM